MVEGVFYKKNSCFNNSCLLNTPNILNKLRGVNLKTNTYFKSH